MAGKQSGAEFIEEGTQKIVQSRGIWLSANAGCGCAAGLVVA